MSTSVLRYERPANAEAVIRASRDGIAHVVCGENACVLPMSGARAVRLDDRLTALKE